MADRTLTINHADGGSETYTINRDKFAGVRALTIDGDTVSIYHTAVPKEQTKETTFGGSQSITVNRDIEPLLSKVVGGAAAAYSLRDLNDVLGNSNKVVQVRRSSDNAEKDFTASEIGADLEDWVGALNDGFVKTWYDQSGNNNHVEQSDPTKQPQLVSNGRVIDAGVTFAGGTANLETASTFDFGTKPVSVFSRLKLKDSASGFLLNLGLQRQFINVASGLRRMRAGLNANSGNSTTETEIWSVIFNTTSQGGDPETFTVDGNFYVDGVLASVGDANLGTQTIGNGTIQIGNRSNETDGLECSVSELVIYNSNQSVNRPAIETNTAAFEKEINLWLTGGQSNSVGITSGSALVTDASYDSSNKINLIAGGWVNTHSYATSSYPTMDYQPQQTWMTYTDTNNNGPDRGFARRLAETYEGVHIAKFAVNGKDLDRYFKKSGSGILNPLYQAMVDQFNSAINQLRVSGYKVNLRGFLWSHGYSDSDDSSRASAYETNLTNFISDVRSDIEHIDADTMPFLITKNAPFWTTVGDTTVETAKANVAAADSNVELVDTTSLTTRDANIHYDAASFEEMGKRAADVFTANFG